MSHLKERTERNCLNCNARVHGKYCHICGQENIDPRETVWHLVSHFFQDITHFDGKFFTTLKFLAFRPGFLSGEYLAGRRASYLNPVRMYVFTSAFFFLIFFTFFSMDENTVPLTVDINGKTSAQVLKMDSVAFADYTRKTNRNDHKPDKPMSKEEFIKYANDKVQTNGINFSSKRYRSNEEYDSALATGTVKDGWIKRQIIYKLIAINNKFNYNANAIVNAVLQKLVHSLPQMMFISLPLFALLLQLLYFRRKEFYYVNHGIFSIHLYIFIFIAMLVLFGLSKLNEQLHWSLITFLSVLMNLGIFFYEYKAMRNFYRQRRGKTILKYFLLNLMFMITMVSLFIVFLFFSFFKI